MDYPVKGRVSSSSPEARRPPSTTSITAAGGGEDASSLLIRDAAVGLMPSPSPRFPSTSPAENQLMYHLWAVAQEEARQRLLIEAAQWEESYESIWRRQFTAGIAALHRAESEQLANDAQRMLDFAVHEVTTNDSKKMVYAAAQALLRTADSVEDEWFCRFSLIFGEQEQWIHLQREETRARRRVMLRLRSVTIGGRAAPSNNNVTNSDYFMSLLPNGNYTEDRSTSPLSLEGLCDASGIDIEVVLKEECARLHECDAICLTTAVSATEQRVAVVLAEGDFRAGLVQEESDARLQLLLHFGSPLALLSDALHATASVAALQTQQDEMKRDHSLLVSAQEDQLSASAKRNAYIQEEVRRISAALEEARTLPSCAAVGTTTDPYPVEVPTVEVATQVVMAQPPAVVSVAIGTELPVVLKTNESVQTEVDHRLESEKETVAHLRRVVSALCEELEATTVDLARSSVNRHASYYQCEVELQELECRLAVTTEEGTGRLHIQQHSSIVPSTSATSPIATTGEMGAQTIGSAFVATAASPAVGGTGGGGGRMDTGTQTEKDEEPIFLHTHRTNTAGAPPPPSEADYARGGVGRADTESLRSGPTQRSHSPTYGAPTLSSPTTSAAGASTAQSDLTQLNLMQFDSEEQRLKFIEDFFTAAEDITTSPPGHTTGLHTSGHHQVSPPTPVSTAVTPDAAASSPTEDVMLDLL